MDVEQDQSDEAATAFTDIRDKLAGLTRAVDSMAGEWKALVIPDYTDTLEKMTEQMQANADQLAEWANKPALELTPKALADAITKAGAMARAEDHAALSGATKAFGEASNSIAARVKSARGRDDQNRWVWKITGATAVGFTILGATVPGFIAHSAPTAWAWPERRAASSLNRTLPEAGLRLIQVDDSDKARILITAAHIVDDNWQVIDGCAKAAMRVRRPERCIVSVKPGEGEPLKSRL